MTERRGDPEESSRLEIVFNCAWHNPPGSLGRTVLEASLKPSQVISDGICDACLEEQVLLGKQFPAPEVDKTLE
jgi:hypothetical protein